MNPKTCVHIFLVKGSVAGHKQNMCITTGLFLEQTIGNEIL